MFNFLIDKLPKSWQIRLRGYYRNEKGGKTYHLHNSSHAKLREKFQF